MSFSVYVFDAYGTLFDVHAAVRRHAAAVGSDAAELSDVWRQKQLEYSWVRSLMNRYEDFWTLTEQALDYAFSKFENADRGTRARLLEAYQQLDCYPEVPEVLKSLKQNGAKLAILSNGSPAMLEGAVRAAGLEDVLDEVFSVDIIRHYKTDPQVYEMVTNHFRVYPEAISFQSSNRWDVARSHRSGVQDRLDQPDRAAG